MDRLKPVPFSFHEYQRPVNRVRSASSSITSNKSLADIPGRYSERIVVNALRVSWRPPGHKCLAARLSMIASCSVNPAGLSSTANHLRAAISFVPLVSSVLVAVIHCRLSELRCQELFLCRSTAIIRSASSLRVCKV